MLLATVGACRRTFVLKDDARSRAPELHRPGAPCLSQSYCKFIRLGLLPRRFQMVDPWRWMATQAIIFLPALIGSTRQYMMKGVPSFL